MPCLDVHEGKKTPKMGACAWEIGIAIEKVLEEGGEFIVWQMGMEGT